MFGGVKVRAPVSVALSEGYSRVDFFDDFLSAGTIDTGYTKNAGYKWYLGSGDWQNTQSSFHSPGTHFSAAGLAVANSALTITGAPATIPTGLAIISAAPSGPSSYIGYVLPNTGFYWESSVKFDPLQIGQGHTGWPAIWSIDIQSLMVESGTPRQFEIDVLEALGSSYAGGEVKPTFHEWAGASGLSPAHSEIQASGINFKTMMADGAFHKFGLLWVPMAYGNGTGTLKLYVDGVHYNLRAEVTDTTYSEAAGSAPAAIPTNFNGVMSSLDAGIMPIIFGAGSDWPMSIDYTIVWARP